jgi:hypothetical protein
MALALRTILKMLAVVIAAAPFVLAGVVWLGGTTSLAVVAPNGLWVLAAVFVACVLIGVALWRLSALVR